MSEKHVGEVVQVIGPVLDIRFAHDELPALLNAIEVDNKGAKLIVEVAQQIGDNTVRCIAMSSTDGLVRGMKAVDTGGPITVPVGSHSEKNCRNTRCLFNGTKDGDISHMDRVISGYPDAVLPAWQWSYTV